MREFIVIKPVCAKCGENLSVTYDGVAPKDSHSDGQPTGADMFKQHISIEPCRICIGQPLLMAKQIKMMANRLEVD